MSLFKARDVWSTVVGENEQFDLGCLCISDLDGSGNDKIIVGSYSGILRIYSPTICIDNKEDVGSVSKPTDFIAEMNLKLPILQVEAAKFTGSSTLAVLQNRILITYALKSQQGNTTHGSQYTLESCYEHKLQKNSYNFTYGRFGGNKNADLICVQSLDGTLSFFDQEVFLFSRFPPDSILPGPIAYSPPHDLLILATTSRQIEAYSFRSLGTTVDISESQSNVAGKKISSEWKVIINEMAISISIVTENNNQIAILGERNIYLLNDSGNIIYTKKLETNPSCLLTYFNEKTLHCIVATHSKSLLIFENIQRLKWISQLQVIPVQVKLATFKNYKNLIVTLSEDGILSCSYLGTRPSVYTRTHVESRDLDYSALNNEIEQLQKVIKEKQNSQSMVTRDASSLHSTNEVKITLTIEEKQSNSLRASGELCTLTVILQSKINLKELKLKINSVKPFLLEENAFTCKNIELNNPFSRRINIKADMKSTLPSNFRIDAIASYNSSDNEPRIVTSSLVLPSGIFIKACPPVKNAVYKLTFETNQPVVSLLQLYSDIMSLNDESFANSLGLQYLNSEMVVTILAAKSSNRYRVQCDEFGAMYHVVVDLLQRLKENFKGSISISYDPKQLPIQEYLEVIEKHFQGRHKREELGAALEEKTGEYRVVQKRLLALVKDKTPVSLQNMTNLLEETYHKIIEVSNKMESLDAEMKQLESELSCCNQLMCLLLRISLNLASEEVKSLEHCLSATISNWSASATGWEELTDACITHILRTALSKSSKDNVSVCTGTLQPLKDSGKVKNHVALLLERISNGARITSSLPPRQTETRQKEKLQTTNHDEVRSMDPIQE